MLHDVWTPMLTSDHSHRNKVAHVDLSWGLARPVPRYAVTVIYRNQQRKKQEIFSVFQKKEQGQKRKKITTAFEKSLFLIKYRMRYAIYMPPNTKDLAINQTMVAYGNRQNATASKQLRFVAITETFNGNQVAISSYYWLLLPSWPKLSLYCFIPSIVVVVVASSS